MTQEEIKERLRALVNKKKVINLEIEKLQDECLANYPIRPGDKCVDKEGRIYWVDRLLFWDTSAIYPTIFAYHQKKDGTCSKRSEQVSNDSITKIEKMSKKLLQATEAKRKLCEIRSNLTDDEQKQAIWIAIRAIDTCTENGFVVEE